MHGVSVRDGASGGDKAIKANLHLTGLPTSLDLNSPAGIYSVGGYHPTIDTLVVDVVLTTIAPETCTSRCSRWCRRCRSTSLRAVPS